MNPKPLLAAIAVLAILGGLVYYTSENPPVDDDAGPTLFDAKEEQIAEVTVARPDKDPLRLIRNEQGEWAFADHDIPADDSSVGFMLNNLESLNADRVVEEEVTDWSPYGLQGDGKLAVGVKLKEGEGGRIIFGNDTPTGAGVYARKEGDPKLYTVYSYVKSGFDKEVFDLRRKKLLAVAEDSISRLTLKVGGREIEFGKSGEDRWQILKPQPLRADNFNVGDLVRSVSNAEMAAVLSEDEEAAGEYDFSKPFAEVEVVDEKGAHTLTIAKADGDKYYARSSGMAGVYEISATTAEGLDKKLEDFRNKKLYDFGFDDPSKLEIQDGERRLIISKKDGDWVLESEDGRKLDSEKVQTLIDSLRNLTAIAFPSDNAADQARYGLDPPAITAQVDPAGDAAVETVLISSPEQDRVYAARKGEPTTYEVEKAPVEEIRRAIGSVLTQEQEKESEAGASNAKDAP